MSGKKGTDVRPRTVLPHAKLQQQAASGANELSGDEYLDQHEESLNKVVDVAVGTLVNGLSDVVSLQRIEGRDHYHLEAQKLQSQIRTEAMIKAAHDLLALTHSLKLMHILSDSDTPAKIKAEKAAELRRDIARLTDQVKQQCEPFS